MNNQTIAYKFKQGDIVDCGFSSLAIVEYVSNNKFIVSRLHTNRGIDVDPSTCTFVARLMDVLDSPEKFDSQSDVLAIVAHWRTMADLARGRK